MKPSKIRVRRRTEQQRVASFGHALEAAARSFTQIDDSPNKNPCDKRSARQVLYDAAIKFTSAVDGEDLLMVKK